MVPRWLGRDFIRTSQDSSDEAQLACSVGVELPVN